MKSNAWNPAIVDRMRTTIIVGRSSGRVMSRIVCQVSAPSISRRLVDVAVDALEAGQQDHGVEAEVGPDADEDDARHGQGRVDEPAAAGRGRSPRVIVLTSPTRRSSAQPQMRPTTTGEIRTGRKYAAPQDSATALLGVEHQGQSGGQHHRHDDERDDEDRRVADHAPELVVTEDLLVVLGADGLEGAPVAAVEEARC